MGQYGRIPDPFEALRKQAPRTGPPVQNMGGTPTQAPTPAAKTVVPSPAVATGAPGPQGAALPPAPTPTLPPMPPGYQSQQQTQQPPAGQIVKKVETTAVPAPAAAQPAAAPQPAAPGGLYQLIGSRPEMPGEDELAGLGVGHGITTPHGDVFRAPDGSLKLRLNDQGKAAYEEERFRMLGGFGAYPGHDDPRAPPPPLTPGLPAFNPFTGQWSE